MSDTAPGAQRGIDPLASGQDFSLVLGGPLFQLLRRSRLSDDGYGLLGRRVVAITLIAWLPLLLISLLVPAADVAVPFLKDVEVHVRFLLNVPVLVAAEMLVHLRIRGVVQQFAERDLVPEASWQRFAAAIRSAVKLRNSVLAEVLLIVLVYTVGTFIWREYVVLDTSTWYAVPGPDGPVFTTAGWWYAYVSLPIFQFLLVRWWFRIFIWARLLWQVSRIRLRLLPTHSDRLGGMAFIAGASHAFVPLAVAHGLLLAAMFANRIFHHGAQLTDFKPEILLMVILMQLLVFGPLLVFSPQLAAAKRAASREYGALVMRHNREFDERWMRADAGRTTSPVGNEDMSSLVDLGASFDVVRGMRVWPVTKESILMLAAATVAPLLPLTLTMMSAEELLKKLAGMLF